MSASCGNRVVGSRVRELAEALAALFAADQQLVLDLNAARRRLLDACDRLRLGSPDDRPQRPAGFGGREAIADAIRQALGDYQLLAGQRREVAADVGEATGRLVDAMAACGFSEAQARTADVRALRDGVYRQEG